MARDSQGSHGHPQYSTSGVPADATDMSELGNYAALVGNIVVGTTTQRNAPTLPAPFNPIPFWEGLWWSDITDGQLYRFTGGSWVRGGTAADGVKIIRAGTAGIFGAGAWTVLNTAGLWAVDHPAQGVTQTNGVITVATAGLYEVTAAVLLDATVSGDLIVKKNSTTADNTGMVGGGSGSGTNSFTVLNLSARVRLAANDTLALAILPSAAAQWNNSILAASFFHVRLLEPLR